MKQAFLMLSAWMTATSAFAGSWNDPQTGITWMYVVSGGEASIGYDAWTIWTPAVPKSTAGEIAVPSTLEGYPVTHIGKWAFFGCDALTSITIPPGVKSIENWAFQDCSALKSVSIPPSVTSIGSRAFKSCGSLETLAIPSGVKSIGENAFESCGKLSSLTIPRA